jgi:hypothetical protein
MLTALLTLFLVTYATGPAGKADLAARAARLDFPKMTALKGCHV